MSGQGVPEPDHVAPLNALARRIAAAHGEAPLFDPAGGGTRARILLMLETPGPARGSDPAVPRVVSQFNATGTARNLRRFFAEAGIEAADVVIWNAVPFLIHAPGARNRPPKAAERAAGLPWIEPLLDLLPDLAVAVLSGRVARGARAAIEALRPNLAILEMPHPSPTFVVTDPAIAPTMIATCRAAKRLAENGMQD
ncbi:uracil-DNA glycosylase [Antarcticirhabdus aurantiaca]|uniref:Uracil-DNA glycosylase n=1 Tax=Antarcticirhabdus aurantiaca TaxID=2606717 RepID=A0ACD4NLY6_9HYPH|nr:uracil-DNA glycosylase [Antarcticirhabdus aurantiaca]WAJ27710.1 uracil-DNA glycosylase [Jeongeuplla avenae]